MNAREIQQAVDGVAAECLDPNLTHVEHQKPQGWYEGDCYIAPSHAAKVADLERAVKALATEVNDWRTQSDEECRLASNYRYDTDQNPIAREAIEKATLETGLGRGATT